MSLWDAVKRRGSVRGAVLAFAGPAVAVVFGLALDRRSPVGATSFALLAVVVAAAWGGRLAGLGASVVAFLGLNLFFTLPYHTFKVSRLEDFLALLVFLASSVIVGGLLSRALDERARADERVEEMRFLDRITARMESGQAIEVLEQAAAGLVETFGLECCQIRLRDGSDAIRVHRNASAGACAHTEGARVDVPLGTGGRTGSLIAHRPPGAPDFDVAARRFLGSLAGQIVLGLERARLHEEAQEARLDAESSRMRAALFSSVTHDLRTPLASIMASASGLLDSSVAHTPAQRDELLRTVVEEAERLNRLLANLLDLARLRAGAMLLAPEPVWVQDLISAVLDRMRRSLDGYEVRVHLRPELPPVQIDATQLDQVITNVVENAVRFSPPGGEIVISATPWNGQVELRITDEGPGIPAEERSRVFEEFFRGKHRRGSGSGLGLAIARAIVEAHGGSIRAEGSPRGGASVVMALPIAAEPPRLMPDTAERASR